MSVRQAQSDIDSAEFSEWIAFHSIQPFTIDTHEYMLAVIASIIANVNRTKGTKSYSPEDFMPQYKKERKRDDPASMEIKLRALLHGNN